MIRENGTIVIILKIVKRRRKRRGSVIIKEIEVIRKHSMIVKGTLKIKSNIKTKI